MAHKDNLDTSFIKNPEVTHEESDVHIRPIALFMVWLTVATAVVMLLMAGMYKYMNDAAEKQDEQQRTPLAGERNPIPPEPLLQLGPTRPGLDRPDASNNSPVSEINAVRKEEDLKLKNYTWVDQSKGIVGLPIDRAKSLILERGALKSRPQPSAMTPPGTSQSAPPAVKENQGPGQAAGHAAGQGAEKKHP